MSRQGEGRESGATAHRERYECTRSEKQYSTWGPFSAWEDMEVRILNAMHACKQRVDAALLIDLWDLRVAKMVAVVNAYQRTFHPHDFYPSAADVCRIPDVREVSMDGTDEEFNACIEGLTSRLPELTSKLLGERTAILSALIPFDERPDNVLSLAAVWFNCESCMRHLQCSLLHGLDALVHECLYAKPVGEVAFDTIALRGGWHATFTFSKLSSAIARELVLDCHEDPESITLAEMNSKLYRFIVGESDQVVCSWKDTVSFSGLVGTRCRG